MKSKSPFLKFTDSWDREMLVRVTTILQVSQNSEKKVALHLETPTGVGRLAIWPVKESYQEVVSRIEQWYTTGAGDETNNVPGDL